MTTESDPLLAYVDELLADNCTPEGYVRPDYTSIYDTAQRAPGLLRSLAARVRELEEQTAKIAALEQERDESRRELLTLNRAFARLRAVVLAALDGLQYRYDALPDGGDDAAERMRQIVDERVRREERLIDEVNAAEKRHDAAIAGIVDGLTKRLDEALNYAHDGTPLSAVAELTGARDSIAALHAAALARHAAEVERVRGVEAAIRSLGRTLATNARDWSLDRADAWLYGALCGWDEALPEVAARHGWSAEDVARLEAIRATLTPGGPDAR